MVMDVTYLGAFHIYKYLSIMLYTRNQWCMSIISQCNKYGDSRRSLEDKMAAHSSILPGKSHGQRSLAGYSPWGRRELDTTE